MEPVINSPVYRRYTQIRQECYNPNNPSYPNVGGQGIECHWRNAREFHKYVMRHLGPPPNGFHSKLTRIDTSKHWEPGNIEWTDAFGVANRHWAKIKIRIGRVERTLSEWLQIYPVNWYTAYSRYHYGWTPEEILGIKPRKKKNVKTKNTSR